MRVGLVDKNPTGDDGIHSDVVICLITRRQCCQDARHDRADEHQAQKKRPSNTIRSRRDVLQVVRAIDSRAGASLRKTPLGKSASRCGNSIVRLPVIAC